MNNLPAVSVFSYTLDELSRAADWLLEKARHSVWLFDAPMGAGKTTLISRILEKLGPEAFLGSPTFSLVHTYRTFGGEPVYHFDLYRVREPEELLDIGFDEYLESGRYVFVEWPQKALPFLDRYTHIRLSVTGPQSREIRISNT